MLVIASAGVPPAKGFASGTAARGHPHGQPLTPAERTGIANECGSLEAGKRADVLVLDEKFTPQRVFIGGIEVKPAET